MVAMPEGSFPPSQLNDSVPRPASPEADTEGNYRRAYRLAVARAELPELDPHGPHDLRHTFATWLEDAGVPVRVIDELMGHQASGRAGRHVGSAIGAVYRHLTPEMQARVLVAVDECLAVALRALAAPSRRQQDHTGSAGDEGMAVQ
jgi:integrase